MDKAEKPLLIKVKVQTKARQASVERLQAQEFRVRVTSPPVKGEANRQVIKLLARYFGVPQGAVTILQGRTSSHKTIAIHRPAS